jgi:hypothetical protein
MPLRNEILLKGCFDHADGVEPPVFFWFPVLRGTHDRFAQPFPVSGIYSPLASISFANAPRTPSNPLLPPAAFIPNLSTELDSSFPPTDLSKRVTLLLVERGGAL